MSLDSLALAILLGLLSEFGDPASGPVGEWCLDSVTIKVTVETAESLMIEWTPVSHGKIMRSNLSRSARRQRGAIVAGSSFQAERIAMAWGLHEMLGEGIGYVSVVETGRLTGWRFRTTIVESFATPREKEIRWSIVHGAF